MLPKNDQIEVVLFGPGFGESLLVHVGNGNWVIIDSCIDSQTNLPAALSYLHSLNIDPSKAVKLIIATHWHDDHIRGLSELVAECKSASFCCSAALSNNEFIATVTRFNKDKSITGGPGVREIYKIYKILEDRGCPIKAVSDKRIYVIPDEETGHGRKCEVWTLSPSDKQIEKFYAELTKLMPEIRETKYRAVSQKQNHTSVVTWFEIGEISILLGGDLQEAKDKETGWSVIVASNARPMGKASIYKVAHHGADNGHCEEVWSEMLVKNPYAILTPYNKGKPKRPSPTDVERITEKTSNAYSTAKLGKLKSKANRPQAVEKTIKESVGKLRRIEPSTGAIRLRNNCSGKFDEWSVHLINDACLLSEVHGG